MPRRSKRRKVSPETRTNVSFSEYKEAKKRFKTLTNKEKPDDSCDNSDALDDIIGRLCKRNATLSVDHDASLFYEVIYRSDFIQIKDEIIDIFYSELCNTFILSDLIYDILRDVIRLENISHVKKYLVQGLLKVLHVAPILENNLLIVKYCENKIWHDIDISRIHSIKICPCAYKIMFSNEKFNFAHFNFLLQLFDVKRLTLNGCNLNGRNAEEFFRGLQLTTLELSECGTSVNEIILNGALDSLQNLKELDISRNPLYNATLEKLRCIPLKNLNVSDCIKKSGKFINSTWFEGLFFLFNEGEKARGKIELLWEEGILRETIEVLNVGYNHISVKNLQKILNLHLKELDITESIHCRTAFSSVSVSNSLRILKASKNKVTFNEFKAICRFPLERLEIDYYGAENEDFSELYHLPLAKCLRELAVNIFESCEHFISFISRFNLKFFECKVDTGESIIDSFVSDYPEQRKHLETLIIGGFGLLLTHEFISELKQLDIRELSVSLIYSDQKFREILCCESLQKSVVKLKLGHKDIENNDLLEVVKFKKIEKLAFSFSNDISEELLRMVVEMETLKEIELEAVVRGQIDLKLAQLLCVASATTLTIYDDNGKSISAEAFDYLIRPENLSQFSKNLVNLDMRGIIKPLMAKIIKSVNWQRINLEHCHVETNSMKLIFDNKNLGYTLDDFTYMDSNITWEYISKLRLSKLEVLQHDVPHQGIHILCQGPISKFLRYLFLEANCMHVDDLLHTSVSQVDTYKYGPNSASNRYICVALFPVNELYRCLYHISACNNVFPSGTSMAGARLGAQITPTLAPDIKLVV